jgi:hypothetical protein
MVAKPTIKLTDGRGTPVLIHPDDIVIVETIGENHPLRLEYDNLTKREGTEPILTVAKIVRGEHEYTLPTQQSVETIQQRIWEVS